MIYTDYKKEKFCIYREKYHNIFMQYIKFCVNTNLKLIEFFCRGAAYLNTSLQRTARGGAPCPGALPAVGSP